MAACTQSFGLWLGALARLLGLTSPQPPQPDYSSISMPDLDARVAELDALRATHLDAAEDLQWVIEQLLEEKASRITYASEGLRYQRFAVPAGAYA